MPPAQPPDPVGRHGFYGRLTEHFPSQVILDLTEVCNLACVHCPHPVFKQSNHYAARYLEPDLVHKLVDEVREHGQGATQYLRFTSQGEPLVHPRGYEMIEYAARESGVYVTLTTNGTIMNEKRTRRLLEAGVHMIDISIDAFLPETYAAIRVNGDLEVTKANVARLLRLVRETGARTKVVVSFVEQAGNSGEADAFDAYWKEQGANYVVVRRLHSNAGAVPEIADMLRRQNASAPRRPCLYPWERVTLNPRGWLAFCPQDWVYGSDISDYRHTTLREVWQGEAYRKLREMHLHNTYRDGHLCTGCQDWKQTRWPGEGRSYADLVAEFRAEEESA